MKKNNPIIIKGTPSNKEIRKTYGISKKEWKKLLKRIDRILNASKT